MARGAGEKTPILPSATTAASSSPRRRYAIIAASVVAIATLVVVTLNVSTNLFTTTTTSPRSSSSTFVPTVMFPAKPDGSRDLLPFCEEKYVTQRLHQFEAAADATYEQRYFLCGRQFFNPVKGSIFFYNGNEADVTLYLNHTGLMWENAEEFNALLVFAEHRYFGKSIPFGEDVLEHMEYLSSTQALADFAVLIEHIKKTDLNGAEVPVIGFGGSYGGMLGAWLRLKYPNVVDGVIAASAPVLNFVGDKEQPVDPEAFQRIVTFDMSPEAGASANCIPNVRRATQALLRLGKTDEGRALLAKTLRLCDPEGIKTEADAMGMLYATIGAFGNLAMGNYPYPSSYITEGAADLPAYPVRAACAFLAPDFAENDDVGLLSALRDAAGIMYNATHDQTCYFPSSSPSDSNQTTIDIKGNFWGYIECSELYMPSSSDGIHDVFPPMAANQTLDDANCMATWGVHIRPEWAVTQYGGVKALRAASNIVFSNGNYDPWSGTGVRQNLSESVVYVPIDGGAHHVDLFFTHPLDPPAITNARAIEKQHIRKWIDEFYARKA